MLQIEPLHQFEMKVGPTENDDRIFLVWPIALSHTIDSKSPLYEYTAVTLPTAQFEIVVLLEGIVESTGMTAQARTSYLPSEILWGHRYETSLLNFTSDVVDSKNSSPINAAMDLIVSTMIYFIAHTR